ncbi:MAG: AAA family ATPase [Candidatus Thorarchaeota archaeon]
MERFLLALCGIPSSGKTTLARAIKDHLMKEIKVEIVSTDRWRDEEFYSDFKPEKERKVRREALEKTRRLVQDGMSVIHDDTNYYASMRHELFAIARQNKTAFAVVHVSTPIEYAIQWNLNREKPVPDMVIEKIANRFDIPGSKYAWDKPIASYNLMEDDPRESAKEIVDRLDTLVAITGEDHSSDKSMEDLLDTITRQVVNHYLDENPSMKQNPLVSKERRSLLTIAKEQGLSPLETEQRLEAILLELESRVKDREANE